MTIQELHRQMLMETGLDCMPQIAAPSTLACDT